MPICAGCQQDFPSHRGILNHWRQSRHPGCRNRNEEFPIQIPSSDDIAPISTLQVLGNAFSQRLPVSTSSAIPEEPVKVVMDAMDVDEEMDENYLREVEEISESEEDIRDLESDDEGQLIWDEEDGTDENLDVFK